MNDVKQIVHKYCNLGARQGRTSIVCRRSLTESESGEDENAVDASTAVIGKTRGFADTGDGKLAAVIMNDGCGEAERRWGQGRHFKNLQHMLPGMAVVALYKAQKAEIAFALKPVIVPCGGTEMKNAGREIGRPALDTAILRDKFMVRGDEAVRLAAYAGGIACSRNLKQSSPRQCPMRSINLISYWLSGMCVMRSLDNACGAIC